MKRFWFLMLVSSFGSALAESPSLETQVANLEAFSRLYGYVRYFHPSDEAASIDWDRFVIYGAQRVKSMKGDESLKQVLEDLFRPVVPTLQIFREGAHPPLPELPAPTGDLPVVAWQHWGVGGLVWDSAYQSKRTHRNPKLPAGQFMLYTQQVPNMGQYVGRPFKLEALASFKRVDYGAQARLMLAYIPEGADPPFTSRREPPITGPAPSPTSFVSVMSKKTDTVIVGLQMTGVGVIEADQFALSVQLENGSWKPIPLKNPQFNDSAEGGWRLELMGDSYQAVIKHREGNPFVSISNMYHALPEEPWLEDFKRRPAAHEMLKKPIGSGLACRFPMALFSDERGTIPAGDAVALNALKRALSKVIVDKPHSWQNLGNAINIWNILQHFFPYWDVVDADFPAVLNGVLRDLLVDDLKPDEATRIINRLAVALQDGHAYYHQVDREAPTQRPFWVDMVEGRLTVFHSQHPLIQRGDLLLTVDDKPAMERYQQLYDNISSSPHGRVFRALRGMSRYPAGKAVDLSFKRGPQTVKVRVEDNGKHYAASHKYDKVQELREGVWYVDLRRISYSEAVPFLDRLAAAKGIVWDMRGYPYAEVTPLIGHLLKKESLTPYWLIPKVIYPDRKDMGFSEYRWSIKPAEPFLGGKMVLLTSAGAQSYAETITSFFEGYDLATIMGQPTVGTNGTVTPRYLPGGYVFAWTGMKVVKKDGSQHHLIGTVPDIPVKRTRADVMADRDEGVDQAIQFILDKTTPVPSSPR